MVLILITEGNATIAVNNVTYQTPRRAAAEAGDMVTSQLLAVFGGVDVTAIGSARSRNHTAIVAFLNAVGSWPGFRMAVACRLTDAIRFGLRSGRLVPVPADTADVLAAHQDLAAVAASGANTRWAGSPAECAVTSALCRAALAPWAPTRHFLFHQRVRNSVYVVMFQVAVQFRAQQPGEPLGVLTEVPTEIWLLICSFFLRKMWLI